MLHIWDHLENCYILKLKLLYSWEHKTNCYFLKLELLHLWEYLKNLYFYYKLCKIKTPESFDSGKYTGVTGLIKFVENI